ncbi:RNaseH domain-containing protein [Nocardia farcinica]|uniref:RNaseH domain-containing protein n=1 Tax=Nocardia farcinica TaxID=37329 RepID=UPI003CC7FAA8
MRPARLVQCALPCALTRWAERASGDAASSSRKKVFHLHIQRHRRSVNPPYPDSVCQQAVSWDDRTRLPAPLHLAQCTEEDHPRREPENSEA